MSMEDLMKGLIDARGSSGSSSGADAMGNLIGSLLGGQPQGGGSSQSGVSGVMNLLENVMSNPGGSAGGGTDPIMMMLQPFVNQLAGKMNISPQIATIVVSFAVHKLLAHHPDSGHDSSSFNLDNMLQQMSSGNIDPTLLQQSGMVHELAQKAGMSDADAQRALQLALPLIGKSAGALLTRAKTAAANASASKPKQSMGAKMGGSMPKPSGAKGGTKKKK